MPPATHASAARALRAVLMAGLVLALGLLAHLPSVHAWLHHGSHAGHGHHAHTTKPLNELPAPGAPDQEAACAITLFAQGLPGPLPPPELRAPEAIALALPPAPPLEVLDPEAPAYLHPPGQAPPLAA